MHYINITAAVTKKELTALDEMNIDIMDQRMMKFIPSSGAATRMFKDLYAYLDEQKNTDFIDYFFDHLEEFAFYKELSTHIDIKSLDKNNVEDRVYIIETLLTNEMNYGTLPKALIKFHQYANEIATPIDEHIFEGESYLDVDDVNLHFTISEEDEDLFND